ncbi:MAG: hypothetical protein ACRDIA_07695, partial [Actinomycetota bacterium]
MKQKGFLTAALGAAVVVAVAAAAWACTPQSTMTLLIDRTPARTRDTATGQVPIANAQVQLRWGTNDGPVVASGNSDANGAFALEFTVPEASGVNYLILTSGGQRLSAAPILVTDPGSAPAVHGGSGDIWSGFNATHGAVDADAPQGAAGSPALPLGIGLLAVGG